MDNIRRCQRNKSTEAVPNGQDVDIAFRGRADLSKEIQVQHFHWLGGPGRIENSLLRSELGTDGLHLSLTGLTLGDDQSDGF